MKLICLSDQHQYFPELPAGDILIIAGDWSIGGTLQEHGKFCTWLLHQADKFKLRLVVAGNHERLAIDSYDIFKEMIEEVGGTYLEDRLITFEGKRFYGSPWTSGEEGYVNYWAFAKAPGLNMEERWKFIPPDLDVLILHTPPHGILDVYKWKPVLTEKGEVVKPGGYRHFGDYALSFKLATMKRPPKVVVMGHVHDSHGNIIKNNIHFYNTAIMDETYTPVNPITVIEI